MSRVDEPTQRTQRASNERKRRRRRKNGTQQTQLTQATQRQKRNETSGVHLQAFVATYTRSLGAAQHPLRALRLLRCSCSVVAYVASVALDGNRAETRITLMQIIASDVNKTLLSRPRSRLFSYFCIKFSDHSFSVNTNNNTKINKEYIQCILLHNFHIYHN